MSSYSAKSALVGGTMDEGSFRSEDESKNESSHSGTQASFNQNANGDDEYGGIAAAKELRETIIKHEEKAVRRSRVMVAVAIIICSVAVTVAVYFLTKKSEQNSFELEVRLRQKRIHRQIVHKVIDLTLKHCTALCTFTSS